MIQPAPEVDLGQDTERMRDLRDVQRQTATVRTLLSRLFADAGADRTPFQLVADEVGMGKTFVALATAFAVLRHVRSDPSLHPDLDGVVDKILILTPSNRALYVKWQREVGEFVRRCVHPDHQAEVQRWFASAHADRWDELVGLLRRKGGPRVVIAKTGALRNYLQDKDAKVQQTLGALFRFWGNRVRHDHRARFLQRAPPHWPREPSKLAAGHLELPLTLRDLRGALDRAHAAGDGEVASTCRRLFTACRQIGTRYVRRRPERWRDHRVVEQLRELYKQLVGYALDVDLPLIVVEEAHNWKNGPTQGSNGYHRFARHLAPHARRLLMVTATPFQLHPSELLELFKAGTAVRASPEPTVTAELADRVRRAREEVIRPVLDHAARASRRFTRAWTALPPHAAPLLSDLWRSAPLTEARRTLHEVAAAPGVVPAEAVHRLAAEATDRLDPDVREVLRTGLRLFAFNRDLSQELGAYVIRHRRPSEHRLFLVGAEYQARGAARSRPDRHLLHDALGLDVRGSGELPQYLLMRCVSEMKKGRGRTSLGTALTGCYSTLLQSAEGRSIQGRLRGSPRGRVYLDLLMDLVEPSMDARHPKVAAVVDAVVDSWANGEKTLLFCFRLNTAQRLRDLLSERVAEVLQERRRTVLGGEQGLRALRGRMTGRQQDLVVLGLDRVLVSAAQALENSVAELALRDEELTSVASIALRAGVDLRAERVDRVFLHRVHEHLVARRLRRGAKGAWRALLDRVADEAWVRRPYGLAEAELDGIADSGVHIRYRLASDAPRPAEVQALAQALRERRERARGSVLDAYVAAPDLWNGADGRVVSGLHRRLWALAAEPEGWRQRLEVLDALRTAVRWDGVLLRLLPERSDLAEESWGELLVQRFYEPLPGQTESMAARFAVFVEDLVAASGSVRDEATARGGLFTATQLRADPVSLVKGGDTNRERVFSGFNSPLLPEILVCTSVGQEGIDLHRHCRQVVHYDLAWNPAVVEQRTGRVDRIGSKTFRERVNDPDALLEVGVPYLAGTYDERMYEELRLRAQTFEVLTGGELSRSGDDRTGSEEEEGESGDLALVPLPPEMVRDLRVDLHVWPEG